MAHHAWHKRLKKALLNNRVVMWCLSRLIANYIRIVFYTSKRIIDMHPDASDSMNGKKNVIFAFWHGRLLMMPMMCPPKRKMHVMISGHNDGLLIAHAMHAFGFGIVEGSSRRGGVQAARGAIEVLERGDNLSITPDGPKGPNMTVQAGVVAISRLTSVPIIPITYTATRHIRFKSWDRFMIALPFSTLYFGIGAPVHPDPAQEESEAIAVLELRKRELTRETDTRAGVA
jgi:lysophospholipid acyltransferase (LPLAT)-like uncharacterized protein